MTWPADIVLVATLIEAVVLLSVRRRAGLRLAPADIIAMLLPGLALLIAVRLALTGSGPWPVAAALAGAGVCHGFDLTRRLRARK